MKSSVVAALGLVLLGTVSASAHHSLAAYNRSTYKTVEGTIKEFQWRNPHAHVVIAVAGADGAVKEWDLEGGSINRLVSRGFSRNSVMPGEKVKVAYNPKRDGTPGGFFLAVTGADGHVFGADALKTFNKGD
jgi:WD40 repeat protein